MTEKQKEIMQPTLTKRIEFYKKEYEDRLERMEVYIPHLEVIENYEKDSESVTIEECLNAKYHSVEMQEYKDLEKEIEELSRRLNEAQEQKKEL